MLKDATTARDSRRSNVTDEHRTEAAKLKAIWNANKARLAALGVGSQLAFGAKFGIGTQAAVGFFLNGQTPLSLKAAMGFATGLNCQVDDFSPRLAAEIEKLRPLFDAGEPAMAASRPATIGQMAMALGASVAGLPESRRRTISALVAAQISDQPDQQEADAIDALAPGLAIDVAPSWREILHGYIDALDAGPDRDLLEAVFAAVDAKHAELAHQKDAKSVGKITHPLGG